jgi:hypothetical protein
MCWDSCKFENGMLLALENHNMIMCRAQKRSGGYMQKKAVSPVRARVVGLLWVNVPVFVIMFGGWGLPLLIAPELPPIPMSNWAVGILVATWAFLPFIAAWSWWSVNVPPWKLWALENCDDWETVERGAISDGLIWDQATLQGRIFTKTELWSHRLRSRETELREARSIPPK